MDRYIQDELTEFVRASDQGAGLTQRLTSHWQAYVTPHGQAPEAWPETLDLAPGIHEITIAGKEFHIGILEQDDHRYTLVINDSDLEQREHLLMRMLVGGVVLSLIFTAWFGSLMARRVIRPIEVLEQYIQGMDSEQPCMNHELPSILATAKDETGILARRFEQYQLRLCEFLQREKNFTGDASHELRTPLSVILAASETLLLNQHDEKLRLRLERISRAAVEMENTLNILLLLARDSTAPDTDALMPAFPVADVIIELVEVERSLRGLSTDILQLRVIDHPLLETRSESIKLVAGNLLRNALDHGLQGHQNSLVVLTLDTNCLSIRDHGPGVPNAALSAITQRGQRQNTHSGDRTHHSGLGLSIAERVCRNHGWTLTFSNPAEGGFEAQWCFGTSSQSVAPDKAQCA